MAPPTLARYRVLFREQRAFRRFWSGFCAAVTADEIVRVGFVWFVYAQTGSPSAVSWLMVCFSAPILVGGLLAGWLLDRFDRRLVMVIDNAVRAVAILLVPLLHGLGLLAIWHLYIVAAVFGLLLMIPLAGSPTLIPALVPAERLQTANALETMGFTVGGVIGPLLGGALLALTSAPIAVLLSGAIYLLYAWILAGLPAQPATSGAKPRAPIGKAVALLLGNTFLIATTAMFLVFNVGLGLLLAALPLFADTRLAAGAAGYGVLLAAFAAGQMAAALAIGALPPDGRLGLRICIAQGLAGLAALALWPVHHGAVAAIILFLFGLNVSPLTVWAQTVRMGIVPPTMRGRTFALLRTLMQAGRPIGGVLAGLLLASDTLGTAIVASALLIGAPACAGLAVRGMREARAQA